MLHAQLGIREVNAGAFCALFSPESEGIVLSTLRMGLPAQLNLSENR